jgi:hypothetical protein
MNTLYLAAVACLLLAGSMSAFAISPAQVARTDVVQTIGPSACLTDDCPAFAPQVSITEPATLTPVIVTWSADYSTTGTSVVGLALNGGPCVFYGPYVLQQPQLIAGNNSDTVETTHQWVVFPSDGLVKGNNTFQMCGGGYQENQVLTIDISTLTVQSQ